MAIKWHCCAAHEHTRDFKAKMFKRANYRHEKETEMSCSSVDGANVDWQRQLSKKKKRERKRKQESEWERRVKFGEKLYYSSQLVFVFSIVMIGFVLYIFQFVQNKKFIYWNSCVVRSCVLIWARKAEILTDLVGSFSSFTIQVW